MKIHVTTLALLLLAFLLSGPIIGQDEPDKIPAIINIQGVLRTADGVAVDGPKDITFRLYETLTGGSAKWTEIQRGLEINSGIYSTVLGSIEPFEPEVNFDRQYFLEIEVSGKTLEDRIPLTPAPYALSLLGNPNKFPSSGAVQADGAVFGQDLDQEILELSPTHSVVVKGGILARGANGADGAPGEDGAKNNGYAFENDKDSGLFSNGNGKITLYSDELPQVEITNEAVQVNTALNAPQGVNTDTLNLGSQGNIKYNGVSDWRLVEINYFEDSDEDWKVYNSWLSDAGATATVKNFGDDDFAGKVLLPSQKGQVFKKKFEGYGEYSYVKVVFDYYFLDEWDINSEDIGWAAFSKSLDGQNLRVGWYKQGVFVGDGHNLEVTTPFNPAANFTDNNDYSDQWIRAEMVGRCSSSFYVFFGGALNLDIDNENFAVGRIEIWVR